MPKMPATPLAVASALLAAVLLPALPAAAAPGDTTWVNTFDQEFINWATPHYATFTFPGAPANWNKVLLFLTIECPGAPADCDPWDRLGHIRVVTPDQGDVEIARFITPYDITGTGYPGSCTWNHNITRFKSLLRDEVQLRLYIESWIGGSNGWLVTTRFAFIEGVQDPEPYRVVNLWRNDHVEYGNPDNPVEAHLAPILLDIPSDATETDVAMLVTGHGQGNTDNCAEFCSRIHSVRANGTLFSHNLWRSNCWANPCSPQAGTWTLSRAGWCPGDRAMPWNVDITGAVTPGQTATLEYLIEDYVNLCRPDTSCVSGVTCADCNYNSTGHTQPHYTVQGNAVFWKPRAEVVGAPVTAPPAADGAVLLQNRPNPFSPSTSFEYTLPRPGPAEILVVDAAGRVVVHERREHANAGTYRFWWDGRDDAGRPVAAGVYFYSLRADGKSVSRKMVRMP